MGRVRGLGSALLLQLITLDYSVYNGRPVSLGSAVVRVVRRATGALLRKLVNLTDT
jgi:hypothetical protein